MLISIHFIRRCTDLTFDWSFYDQIELISPQSAVPQLNGSTPTLGCRRGRLGLIGLSGYAKHIYLLRADSDPLFRAENDLSTNHKNVFENYAAEWINPAGTRRNDNVFITSKRRRRRRFDVMKTLSLRHYCVMCPLGRHNLNQWGFTFDVYDCFTYLCCDEEPRVGVGEPEVPGLSTAAWTAHATVFATHGAGSSTTEPVVKEGVTFKPVATQFFLMKAG